MRAVVPTDVTGERLFVPGRWATVAVAVALTTMAIGMAVMVSQPDPPGMVRWVVAAGVGILVLRAIGDGKYAGFSKTFRASTFARYDDRVFTPLMVILALTGLSALLV